MTTEVCASVKLLPDGERIHLPLISMTTEDMHLWNDLTTMIKNWEDIFQ